MHDLTTKTAEAAAELRHHLGALGKRRDYHTHIIESWVETNEQFGNPWEFLFEGDHYVMRLMRLHKIDEKYIT